jgi:hypothetical protein
LYLFGQPIHHLTCHHDVDGMTLDFFKARPMILIQQEVGSINLDLEKNTSKLFVTSATDVRQQNLKLREKT